MRSPVEEEPAKSGSGIPTGPRDPRRVRVAGAGRGQVRVWYGRSRPALFMAVASTRERQTYGYGCMRASEAGREVFTHDGWQHGLSASRLFGRNNFLTLGFGYVETGWFGVSC